MISWKKLYEFLECSAGARGLEGFCRASLRNFRRLIDFDGAFFWLCRQPFHPVVLPDATVMCDFPAEFNDLYLSYFYTIDPLQRLAAPADLVRATDWNDFSGTEFVTDLLQPNGVRHSLGFFLHDRRLPRFAVATFFRTGRRGFEAADLRATRTVLPALLSLFERALLESEAPSLSAAERQPGRRTLSRRELEIARLLCTSLRAAEIAGRLGISPRTAEKHVEHIYDKLGVSRRRELVAVLMEPDHPELSGASPM